MTRTLNKKGFSLPELLVGMVVALVVMAGIYTVYYSQQKSYVLQDQVAQMQKNLRMAMFFMEKEIRMAGLDPKGSARAGIVTANSNTLNFTFDIDGDGNTTGPTENITYRIVGNELQRVLNNKIIDAGPPEEPFAQTLARNIDALNFAYLDETRTATTAPDDVRSVQIALLARTGKGDLGFTDNTDYKNLRNESIYQAQGDNNRRRLLVTRIKCRNLMTDPGVGSTSTVNGVPNLPPGEIPFSTTYATPCQTNCGTPGTPGPRPTASPQQPGT